MVDLDADYGKTPRPGKENKSYCIIRSSKVVRMAVIQAYLSKQMAFDNSVLEAISKFAVSDDIKPNLTLFAGFLDHLMREYPSKQYTAIKRQFFSRGNSRHPLDNVIEAMKGVYSSLRLCDVRSI